MCLCVSLDVCFTATAGAAVADPDQYAQRVADGNMIKVKAKTSSNNNNMNSNKSRRRNVLVLLWELLLLLLLKLAGSADGKDYAKARQKLFDVCAKREREKERQKETEKERESKRNQL